MDETWTGALDGAGGSIQLGPVELGIEAGVLDGTVEFVVARIDTPPLPDGLESLLAVDISVVSGAEFIDGEFDLTMTSPEALDERPTSVWHIGENGAELRPVLDVDFDSGAITTTADTFSPFVLSVMTAALPPQGHALDFDPIRDGFAFPNPESVFSSRGLCIGMASFASWMTRHGRPMHLDELTMAEQQVVAARAFMAERSWTFVAAGVASFVPPSWQTLLAKLLVSRDELALLLLESAPNMQGEVNKHAVLAYAYDETSVLAYDPNYARTSVMEIAGDGSISYEGWNRIFVVPAEKNDTAMREIFNDLLVPPAEPIDIIEQRVEDGSLIIHGSTGTPEWDWVSVFHGNNRVDLVGFGGEFESLPGQIELDPENNDVLLVAGDRYEDKEDPSTLPNYAAGSAMARLEVERGECGAEGHACCDVSPTCEEYLVCESGTCVDRGLAGVVFSNAFDPSMTTITNAQGEPIEVGFAPNATPWPPGDYLVDAIVSYPFGGNCELQAGDHVVQTVTIPECGQGYFVGPVGGCDATLGVGINNEGCETTCYCP